MDQFAPYIKINGCFIVQNTSPQVKTISIFQYPINYGQTRDLLQIPGVSEGDIRSSLLKGELQHKIRAKDIVVICSDIELLQFNAAQRSFLQNSGIVNGLRTTTDQRSVIWMQDMPLIGTVNGTNTIFKIPSGTFIENSTYKIVVYLNGVKQVFADDYLIAESGGAGTGFDTVVMTVAPEASVAPPDVVTADYYINNP